MNEHEATNIVSRMSYKPGWKIECDVEREPGIPHDWQMFRILGTSPLMESTVDGIPNGTLAAIVDSERIPLRQLEHMDTKALVSLVKRLFRRIEMHELDEWLLLDGLLLVNPHPERSPQLAVL